MRRLIFLCILTALAQMGCNHETRAPNNPHRPNAPATVFVDTTNPQDRPAVNVPQDSANASTWIAHNSEQFLTPKAIKDPELRETQDFRDGLKKLHSSLIQLSKESPAQAAKHIKAYDEVYLKGCVSDYIECWTLTYLKEDGARAFQVLLLVIKQNRPLDIETYYSYLYAGHHLKTRNFDHEFEKAYFKRAIEWLDFLAAAPQGLGEKKLQLHLQLLSQIIEDKSSTSFREDVLALARKVNPFLYSRKSNSALNQIRRKLLAVVLNTGKVEDHIRNQLRSAAAQAYRDYEEERFGLFSKAVAGKNVANEFHLSKLRSDRDKALFFVLYQVFQANWDSSQAQSFVHSEGMTLDELIKMAEFYIRCETLFLHTKSAQFMSQYFQNEWSPDDYRLLEKGKQKADQLTPLWTRFHQGAEQLKLLLQTQLDPQSDSQSNQLAKLYFLDHLDHNINLISVYPNMLAMTYYVSLSDNKAADPDAMVMRLFERLMNPWFHFTRQGGRYRERVSPPEILMAASYALKTGLFEIYGISFSQFIEQLATRMLGQDLHRFDITHQAILNQFGRNGTEGNQTRKICRGQAQETLKFFDLMQFTTPHLLNLYSMDHAYYDLTVKTGHGSKSDSWKLVNELETLRVNFQQKLDIIQSLRQMYELQTENSAEKQQALQTIDEIIQPYSTFKKRFLGSVFSIHEDLESCISETTLEERRRQKLILKYEIEHLKKVYQTLEDLHQSKGDLTAANQEFKVRGWPNGYDGFDHISTDHLGRYTYNYHAMDFLVRASHYMTDGSKTATGQSLPAITPNVLIQRPNDLLQPSPFAPFSKRKPALQITWHPELSQDAFIAQALTRFHGDDDKSNPPFVLWRETLQLNKGWVLKQQAHFMTILYRMGEVQAYDFHQGGCNPDMTSAHLEESCLQSFAVSANDLAEFSLALYQTFGFRDSVEMDLYRMRGLSHVFPPEPFVDIIFEEATRTPVGAFNAIFNILKNDRLGRSFLWPYQLNGRSVPSIIRFTHKEIGYHYYRAIKTKGAPLLSLPRATTQMIDRLYQDYIRSHFEPIRRFEEQIANTINSQGESFSYLYDLNDAAVEVPLFIPPVEDSQRMIEKYNKETQGLFEDTLQKLDK